MLAEIMSSRTFIENQSEVSELFEQLEQDIDYIFINPMSGQRWERYAFEIDNEVVFGLRKYPNPELETVIKIILDSDDMDEVSGACGFLSEREYEERFEFRQELIEALENNVRNIDSERFEIIYYRAVLSCRLNKRDVLGKSIEQVMADATHFEQLADRAEKLKKLLLIE